LYAHTQAMRIHGRTGTSKPKPHISTATTCVITMAKNSVMAGNGGCQNARCVRVRNSSRCPRPPAGGTSCSAGGQYPDGESCPRFFSANSRPVSGPVDYNFLRCHSRAATATPLASKRGANPALSLPADLG
jgi:hypothetical protein